MNNQILDIMKSQNNNKTKVYTQAYVELLCACYLDVASAYPAIQYAVEQKRDLSVIRARHTSEGDAFLTKTLPSMAKAIDIALATGTVLQVPSFSRKKGSKLPKFLGWLIGQVFSTEGKELAEADPYALMHLRNLLYLVYKLQMPYAEKDISRVLESFISTDSDLDTVAIINDRERVCVLTEASRLIARVLGNADPRNIIPRNGPGSVATGEKLDEKSYFKRSYKSAEEVYPSDSHFYLNSNHISERLTAEGLTFANSDGLLRPQEELDAGTAKVVLVPKDSRGPRLISMEPLEIQWLQQGQMDVLVSTIEDHWLTRGHVNFKNQEINRSLALYASMLTGPVPQRGAREIWNSLPACARPIFGKRLATLDMKDASDRVSLALLYGLFPKNWIEALEATRSTRTMLPDGRVVTLRKFAPMGSAVCFPVEALIFWAIAASAVMHNIGLINRKPRRGYQSIWVYGDDIVCYEEDYLVVKQSLESAGLMLNANKCCTAGSFRESCGMDAYKGVQVTPLRVSKCVDHRWPGQNLAAYVSYSNRAYARGYTNLAGFIENLIQEDGVKVSYTTEDRGFIQFVRPDADVRTLNRKSGVKTRFCRDRHCLVAHGPTPVAARASGKRVTWESYFVRFLSSSNPPRSAPQDHESEIDRIINDSDDIRGRSLKADQYPVPRRISPKRGWKQISI